MTDDEREAEIRESVRRGYYSPPNGRRWHCANGDMGFLADRLDAARAEAAEAKRERDEAQKNHSELFQEASDQVEAVEEQLAEARKALTVERLVEALKVGAPFGIRLYGDESWRISPGGDRPAVVGRRLAELAAWVESELQPKPVRPRLFSTTLKRDGTLRYGLLFADGSAYVFHANNTVAGRFLNTSSLLFTSDYTEPVFEEASDGE